VRLTRKKKAPAAGVAQPQAGSAQPQEAAQQPEAVKEND